MDRHSYNIDIRWDEGRVGTASSPQLPVSFRVATPPEFDKGVPGIWSPEHLFTASVASCFMTTFLAIAEYSKLEYISFNCPSEGILDKVDGKFIMTEVILRPQLVLPAGGNAEKAERILQKAEAACLITNSVRSSVRLEPTVTY